ncbi:MAG: hypothetical protein ACE5HU_06300 [Acidobacteriota bacterium]
MPRGKVEIKSLYCIRFVGPIPVPTCQAAQRTGCTCENAETLERILTHA